MPETFGFGQGGSFEKVEETEPANSDPRDDHLFGGSLDWISRLELQTTFTP